APGLLARAVPQPFSPTSPRAMLVEAATGHGETIPPALRKGRGPAAAGAGIRHFEGGGLAAILDPTGSLSPARLGQASGLLSEAPQLSLRTTSNTPPVRPRATLTGDSGRLHDPAGRGRPYVVDR